MSTSTADGPPLRRDSLRNRNLILEVAAEEVAAGNLALQLNDIARRAGVGVGTVYRHFPSPKALLESLVADRLQELVSVTLAAAEALDVQAALRLLIRTALSRDPLSAALTEVLAAAEDAQQETSRTKKEFDAAVDRLLGRARDEYALRDDITAEDLRRLVCGIGHAVYIAESDHEAIADRYVDILLAGLRPTAEE